MLVVHERLIAVNAPAHYATKIPAVIQKIINQSWRADGGQDIHKLSRWLRTVFRMTMTTSPEIALRCVDQAASIAARTKEGRDDVYPGDELEWLASTAFNHAVDLYCAGQVEQCREWAERALNLAREDADEVFFATMKGLWMKLTAQME